MNNMFSSSDSHGCHEKLHDLQYEEWRIWTGKRIIAPPPSLSLLFRGLGMQAYIFGPTFGVVATIYELA
eukprot:scaffold764_cov240-Chaetoceros_neogracile.AAC.7